MSISFPMDADVAIAGAGIVGLAHAYDAVLRGLRVAVVDRDPYAVGASVRNFGHGIASALAGTEAHAVALEARERWLALGHAAGFAASAHGTLMVARHADELAAMAAFADRHPEIATVLSPRAAADLAPIPAADAGVLGALHAPGDLRVDAERAVGAIATYLADAHGVRFAWGARVDAYEPGVLHTARGPVRAPAIVLCPGAELLEHSAREGLTRCRLQMLEVEAPAGRRYGPALMTGLSLLRYPGFAALPEVAAVRERLEAHRPDIVDHGVHLIVTQRPDGRLVVGDTHAYGVAVEPWREEALDELLLAEAGALLGARELRVRRRWVGVYPAAPGSPFAVEAPCRGVRVVGVVSGIGMTTALGLAPRVLDGLLADQAAAGGAAGVDDAAYATPDRGSTSTWSVIENASPR